MFFLYFQAALSCIDKSRQLAAKYLASAAANTPNKEIFHLAITAYAMSLSRQKSRTIFDKLWALRNQCKYQWSKNGLDNNADQLLAVTCQIHEI